MKRIARYLLIILILLILCLFVIWKLAPSLISETLSKKSQVAVTIDDIDLSMRNVRVDKIQIMNPKGSLLPKAFSVSAISIDAPLWAFLSNDIVIDKIELKDIYLDIELSSSTSASGNWATILSNLSSGTSKEKKKAPAEKRKGGSIVIKKLILTNISGDIVLNPLLGTSKKIAPIQRLEFTDLSSDSGATIAAITSVVLEETIRTMIMNQNLPNFLSPSQTLQNLSEPFKGLLPK